MHSCVMIVQAADAQPWAVMGDRAETGCTWSPCVSEPQSSWQESSIYVGIRFIVTRVLLFNVWVA